ncbi:hypothetical protein D3C79_749990 [compost metagenome]
MRFKAGDDSFRNAATQAQGHGLGVGHPGLTIVTVVVVRLGHLEHGRIEQGNVRLCVLVDVTLKLAFLLLIFSLERGPLRFVVALFKPLVTLLLRTLDQQLPLDCRGGEHRRPIARHRFQRRHLLRRPFPVRGTNDLQDLRGLQLIGAHRFFTPGLTLQYPVQALMVVLLNQPDGVVEH